MIIFVNLGHMGHKCFFHNKLLFTSFTVHSLVSVVFVLARPIFVAKLDTDIPVKNNVFCDATIVFLRFKNSKYHQIHRYNFLVGKIQIVV